MEAIEALNKVLKMAKMLMTASDNIVVEKRLAQLIHKTFKVSTSKTLKQIHIVSTIQILKLIKWN